MSEFILALDQGTTSSRALTVDAAGVIRELAQQEFQQIYPEPGWVEHNPMDIWHSQLKCAQDVVAKAGGADKIKAIGITNQRETTIIWDKKTGKPIHNAIVWQDRRTAALCDELKKDGLETKVQGKTGLVIDAYFSASKIRWILDQVPGARDAAKAGQLAFGTVDSWLIWNLTGGKAHVTDASNASRSMLYNIFEQQWDTELLDILNIPVELLPKVRESSEIVGETAPGLFARKIPIAGIAGDQHAALFGQMCTDKGMAKNTYGTGCFLMMNTGEEPIQSKNKLVTTVAWKKNQKLTYALEGSIFMGGAIIQWLRDELKIIESSSQIEELALSVKDNGGVYLVPAFVGLGAPHWDQYARGTILGLTRGSNRGHMARAALESIAYQTYDVLHAMESDAGFAIKELRVDGGASINKTLMQFQSDILGNHVIRPKILETTALGAAYFAGLASGFWKNEDEIASLWQKDAGFSPAMDESIKEKNLMYWHKAIDSCRSWYEPGT